MPGLKLPGKSLADHFKRAYHRSELKKLQRWLKGKTLHWSLYLVLSCLVLGGLLYFHFHRFNHFYVVRIDGKEVGLVRNIEKVEQYLDDLTGSCCCLYKMELYPKQKITLTREYRPGRAENFQAIQEACRKHLDFLTDAVMVTVDGYPAAPVSTVEEVERVEKAICQTFVKVDERTELLDVELLEKISGEKCTVAPEQVCAPAEVASLLTRQKLDQELPVASRKMIASRSGGDRAEDGTGLLPAVHVRTIEKITVEEQIPFDTAYVINNKMYRGESRVITPGKCGLKKVTYRVTYENGIEQQKETVSNSIIAEPTTRVVERGTLRKFAWPVSGGGVITQRFHAGHRGVDIAAPMNTPILAAESGTVVYSGWGPTQGNYIVIKHGAYYTTYLHNSKHLVSVGQRVSRGQTIARMGSTGRSTGPHLHFEIRRASGPSWSSWNAHPAINPLQFY